MKGSLGTTIAIVGLSLAVWVFFFVLTPGEPLTRAETTVVVGVCAALVIFGKWIWTRLRKGKEAE